MTGTIACVAPVRRVARETAAALAARFRRIRPEPFSLAEYLASPVPPRRVVLCPAGRSLTDDLRFLRRAAGRLLWPLASPGFRNVIGGLRAQQARSRPRGTWPPRTIGRGGLAAALLLEGTVGPERARGALGSAPRDWIVESPRHVCIPARLFSALERAGVRWSVLEPVALVAIYATPELARARARWKPLVAARTRVWVRGK